MYLINEGKPYYYDGEKVYKCELTKEYAKVDFSDTADSFPFNCVYTLDEVKKLLLDGTDSVTSMEAKTAKRAIKSKAKKG